MPNATTGHWAAAWPCQLQRLDPHPGPLL